jgi:hypothetical protein
MPLGVLGWPTGSRLLAGVPVCDIPRFWYRRDEGPPGVATPLPFSALVILYESG